MEVYITRPDIHHYMLKEHTHPSLIYRLFY